MFQRYAWGVLILLLMSCMKEEKTYLEWEENLPRFQFITEIEQINTSIINNSQVNLAPGSWHTVLAGRKIDGNLLCLLFRSPSKNDNKKQSDGALTIYEGIDSCEDGFFLLKKFIDNLQKFKITLVDRTLKISLTQNGDSKKPRLLNYKIDFFNVSSFVRETKLKRSFYSEKSSSFEMKYILGEVRIFDSKVEPDGQQEWDDSSYDSAAQVFCHKINEKCETVEEYTCDTCPFGWYETTGSGCRFAGHKLCGTNRCGQKGEPACPRGQYMGLINQQQQCDSGSNWGFCEQGLSASCDSNGVLVCR